MSYCHKHAMEHQRTAPIRITGISHDLDGEFCGACYAELINANCTRLTPKGMQLDPEPVKPENTEQAN
jgi:hypothetical protein